MNQPILSKKEIENENIRMQLESKSLVSLKHYPKLIKRQKIIEDISNKSISNMEISKNILENRNIKKIPEEVTIDYGITKKRTTLHYFPTTEDFYTSKIVSENTATEIPFATPILILHHSLDEMWLFIQCSFYQGWILKKDILFTNEQVLLLFDNPEKFIVITKPFISFQNTFLELGTILPLLGIHEQFYEVLIPAQENIQIEAISKTFCNIDFLPYTKENILKLANSCIGIPYSWGGKTYGFDCSLFVFNLFKTFGFLFPRDSKEQEKTVGLKKIILKGKTEIEKKEILLDIEYPALLHKNGHILLAISPTQVIHAYGDAGKIILSNLESCYGTNLYPFLTSISYLVK